MTDYVRILASQAPGDEFPKLAFIALYKTLHGQLVGEVVAVQGGQLLLALELTASSPDENKLGGWQNHIHAVAQFRAEEELIRGLAHPPGMSRKAIVDAAVFELSQAELGQAVSRGMTLPSKEIKTQTESPALADLLSNLKGVKPVDVRVLVDQRGP